MVTSAIVGTKMQNDGSSSVLLCCREIVLRNCVTGREVQRAAQYHSGLQGCVQAPGVNKA